MKNLVLLLIFCAVTAGCAGAPKVYKVESVYVCAAEECGQAAQNYGTEQLLSSLQRLLAENENQTLYFCESTPQTHACKSNGVCHYVQGGLFPGLGCMKSTSVIAPKIDETKRRIQFQSNSRGSFLGIPAICATHGAAVTMNSIDEIVWEIEPTFCNWMAVGNSTNTFSLAIDYLDFDRGIIGGYWTHGAGGTGVGKGTGYGILQLSKGMPKGENWLASHAKN